MTSRQAIWRMPVITGVLLFGTLSADAQTPQPKSPVVNAVNNISNSSSSQIVPVSYKNEEVAAVVNGEKILVGDVRKILDQRPYPDVLRDEQKKQLRQAALDVLVEDAIVRQYLNKQVAQVSQTDFNKEVQELQEVLKKQGKTIDSFVAETGQSKEQLQRDIVAKLQWKVLLQQRYPEDKLKPYYDANKLFFDKVFVQASHILIKVPANATMEQRNQVVQQMLVWRQEIIAGKLKFEDVAKQYSQCPTKDNKEKPGDIGQFPFKFVVLPEFAKAAFAMKVGDVSEVVQTISGLHLIKVTDRTKGEPSTFEAMKETVRETWAQDDELYQRVLTEQRKTSEIKLHLQ